MKIIQEAENIVRLTRKGLCASIRVLLLPDKYLFQFINDSDSQTDSENEILKNNIAKLSLTNKILFLMFINIIT